MAVTLSLEGIKPQRRATVAFRFILAIPHLIFTAVLTTVAYVVIFLAWFAALFTGRLPSGMHDFLVRILQYQARVYAYCNFLATDEYPPFDVGAKDYPVMLEVAPAGTLNRAAVFFRFFLQLPALLLTYVLLGGSWIVMFFVWLITLVSGRVPTSAYVVLATILRYQMRTFAYVGMLTPEWPWGLFGDRDQSSAVAVDDVVDEVATFDTIDAEPAALPASPRIDRFVLSRGQKALIWLMLLLGAGWMAFNVAATNLDFGRTAELVEMADEFEDAYVVWNEDTRDCARGAESGVTCSLVNENLRSAIERYQRRLFVFEVPESAVDDGVEVIDELEEMHVLLGQMEESGDSDEQLRLFLLMEDAKRDYDDEYDDLFSAVSFG
jgi:hypothetical protein